MRPLRLLCLPPSGGGAGTFAWLKSRVPTSIEVVPVTLPGREARSNEPLRVSMGDLVDLLSEELADKLSDPYGIVGYSMGGIIGLELVRRWRAQRRLLPRIFIVISANGPQISRSRDGQLHHLNSQAFRNALAGIGGTPPEVLDNPALMAIVEPTLRADFQLCETYEYVEAEPFDIPIHAFVGSGDHLVTPKGAEGWKQCTRTDFELHTLNCGHMLNRPTLQRVFGSLAALWRGQPE